MNQPPSLAKCWEGSAERLRRFFMIGAAAMRALDEAMIVVAGESQDDYTAMLAAVDAELEKELKGIEAKAIMRRKQS